MVAGRKLRLGFRLLLLLALEAICDTDKTTYSFPADTHRERHTKAQSGTSTEGWK